MKAGRRRGGLFGKYVVVLVLLVCGVLVTSSLVELYFAYQETQRALIQSAAEKALGAAQRIQRVVIEIERGVRATTRADADDPAVAPPGGLRHRLPRRAGRRAGRTARAGVSAAAGR